jgi:uncharacterized protein YdiU (UPF0061 family)
MAVFGETVEALVRGVINDNFNTLKSLKNVEMGSATTTTTAAAATDSTSSTSSTTATAESSSLDQDRQDAINSYILIVRNLAKTEFQKQFLIYYKEMRRKKLGFEQFNNELDDEALWGQLIVLLYKSKCDYTIFFRQLIKTILLNPETESQTAVEFIEMSFYQTTGQAEDKKDSRSNNIKSSSSATAAAVLSVELREEWNEWFKKYLIRHQQGYTISTTTTRNDYYNQRIQEMTQTNPKYVLRNWMSVLAYDRASQGDLSVLNELQRVLAKPYEEGTEGVEAKWYRKTPVWAKSE